MSKPLKSATKRAAESIQIILDQPVPKEPEEEENPDYLLEVCETLDLLNNDIEEMTDAYNDLKEANNKWSSLIQRSTQIEKPLNEAAYDEATNLYKIDDTLNEAGKRLRKLKESERKLKLIKRREERKEKNLTMNNTNGQKSFGFSFKPPRQELSKFSGKHIDWPEWWQIYNATVHEAEGNDEVKHAVLKQCVIGEAKQLIAGLKLTDYDIAIELLKQKYGNEEDYTRNLHSQLENLAVCQNFQDCRKFAIELERICRLLENNDQNINGQGVWMSLEKKLTIPILREMQTKKALAKTMNINWNTEAFRKALREVIEKEEIVLSIHGKIPEKSGNRSEPKNLNKNKEKELNRTLANVEVKNKKEKHKNKIEGGRRSPIYPCIFCGKKNHWGDECRKINSAKDRRKKLIELKRCLFCIKPEHEGNCKKPIKCFHCREKHNTALCEETYKNKENNIKIEGEVLQNSAILRKPRQKRILLCREAVLFNPSNPDKNFKGIVFIDCGSQKSYIRKGIAQKLGLQTSQKEVQRIQPFPANRSPVIEFNAEIFRLGIEKHSKGQMIVEVGQLDNLNSLISQMPAVLTPEDENDIDLKSNKIPHSLVEPDVLLGVEYFFDLNLVRKKKLNCGLWLADSAIGPIIGGKGQISNNKNFPSIDRSNVVITEEDEFGNDTLENKLEKLYSLDSIGINDISNQKLDEKIRNEFESKLTFKNGRYEAGWLWKEPCPKLPSNYRMAKSMLLNQIEDKQKKNPHHLALYEQTFADQVEKGIIEEIPRNQDDGGQIHYLTHFPIVREDKTFTKFRIVFNASGKSRKDNPSLNDCLHQGPVTIQDLCGLLMRCRLPTYLIAGDLQAAFLQISLRPEDRNCVRFLWVKDVKKPASSQNDEDLKIFRYARVTFGVNCSPSILGMTVDYHLAKYDSSTAEKLKKAGYVDNFLIGAEEKSEVEKDILEARKIFQEAGWNFREIFTNAIKQLNAIPVDKLPIEARTTNLHSSAKQKILGIIWDTFYDALSLKLPVPKMTEEKQWTKRKVLATIAECFDPCGLISPALLKENG
uniref:Uncharacterized protein n=1 Tax=Meloidogyne enterolobii TaxID=390850 RepID=A0A6V7XSW1_MELEN|nr:unnamed protein product [Meloidogyne enterolobii]